MSRTTHRFFSSSFRPSTRVCLNTAARSPRAAVTRRMMSSQSHASHGSTQSDRPWMVGSALVFGPLFLYLVSPSARKTSHGHAEHGHENHRDEHKDEGRDVVPGSQENVIPITDDEGTTVSGQEVKESMEKAYEADSPRDAKEQEVAVTEETTTLGENLAQTQAESTDDTTIPESESNLTPAAVVIDTDEPADATSDEKAQSAASDPNDGAMESKA